MRVDYTDADGHAHRNTNSDCNRDRYGNVFADSDRYGDTNNNAHTDSYFHAHGHTDGYSDDDRDCHRNGDGHSHRYCDSHGYTHNDGYADTHAYPHANPDGDTHANTHGNSHADSNSDGNLDRDPNRDSDCDAGEWCDGYVECQRRHMGGISPANAESWYGSDDVGRVAGTFVCEVRHIEHSLNRYDHCRLSHSLPDQQFRQRAHTRTTLGDFRLDGDGPHLE